MVVRQERVECEPAKREQHAGHDDRGTRACDADASESLVAGRRRRVAGRGLGARNGGAHGCSAYGNLPVFEGSFGRVNRSLDPLPYL